MLHISLSQLLHLIGCKTYNYCMWVLLTAIILLQAFGPGVYYENDQPVIALFLLPVYDTKQ